MRLNNYISEAENAGLGITFVDLDETLFYTHAHVMVKKDGEVIHKLSNAEYNAYTLQPGEEWDYGEFRSAKLFHDTSVPIEQMMKRIIRIIKKGQKKGSKVIILTARSDLDNKKLFLDKFRKEGFPIDQAFVERAGNKMGSFGASVSVIKKLIIMDYLTNGLYRRVRLFDDYLNTCREFLKIKNDIPSKILDSVREKYELYDLTDDELISFESYHVQTDGSVRRIG